jgi:hypothetical protein
MNLGCRTNHRSNLQSFVKAPSKSLNFEASQEIDRDSSSCTDLLLSLPQASKNSRLDAQNMTAQPRGYEHYFVFQTSRSRELVESTPVEWVCMHVLGQLQHTLALLPLSSDGLPTRCLFVPPGGL